VSDPSTGGPASRAPRVRARIEAGYEDPERQVFLPTHDLSETGVFLLSEDAPPVGSRAQVVLELPGNEAFLRLSGTVSRTQEGPPAGFAVQFDESARGEDARAALRAFIARERPAG